MRTDTNGFAVVCILGVTILSFLAASFFFDFASAKQKASTKAPNVPGVYMVYVSSDGIKLVSEAVRPPYFKDNHWVIEQKVGPNLYTTCPLVWQRKEPETK